MLNLTDNKILTILRRDTFFICTMVGVVSVYLPSDEPSLSLPIAWILCSNKIQGEYRPAVIDK